MSEQSPTYFIRDFCGVCGEQLVVQPNGTKIACHPEAHHDGRQWSQTYWSEAVPLPQDLRGFMQLTGREPRMQTEWYDFKPGSDSYGRRIENEPLFLYRSIST